MSADRVLIDPPSGWMYGFPKVYDKLPTETLEDWFRKNGYPQRLIGDGLLRYCRYLGSQEALDNLFKPAVTADTALDSMTHAASPQADGDPGDENDGKVLAPSTE